MDDKMIVEYNAMLRTLKKVDSALRRNLTPSNKVKLINEAFTEDVDNIIRSPKSKSDAKTKTKQANQAAG